MLYSTCQQLFARLKQIVIRIELRQQPSQRSLVSLKLSASEDMHYIDAYRHKLRRNQQCPVAVQWLFFCPPSQQAGSSERPPNARPRNE